MKSLVIFIAIFYTSQALALVDFRVGGGVMPLFSKNENQIPPPVNGGSLAGNTSFNGDIIFADWLVIFGARYMQSSSENLSTFYFDTGANQYTKFDFKHHHSSVSGIIGIRYKEPQDQATPDGETRKLSAAIFAVVPLSANNEVFTSFENNTGRSNFSGKPQSQNEFGIYLEGTSRKGRFVSGLQIGYLSRRLSDFRDSSNNVLNNYLGNPLELDLSGLDIRIYIGVSL